jgi:hypothetical protein
VADESRQAIAAKTIRLIAELYLKDGSPRVAESLEMGAAALLAAEARGLKEIEQAMEGYVTALDGRPNKSLLDRVKILIMLTDKCAATECEARGRAPQEEASKNELKLARETGEAKLGPVDGTVTSIIVRLIQSHEALTLELADTKAELARGRAPQKEDAAFRAGYEDGWQAGVYAEEPDDYQVGTALAAYRKSQAELARGRAAETQEKDPTA